MNGIILYEMWPYFTQIRFVPLRLSTWFIMYKEHKFSDISFIYVAKQNSSRWSWHCWDKALMTTTMMMVVMIHLFVLCSSLQGANSYWSKIRQISFKRVFILSRFSIFLTHPSRETVLYTFALWNTDKFFPWCGPHLTCYLRLYSCLFIQFLLAVCLWERLV